MMKKYSIAFCLSAALIFSAGNCVFAMEVKKENLKLVDYESDDKADEETKTTAGDQVETTKKGDAADDQELQATNGSNPSEIASSIETSSDTKNEVAQQSSIMPNQRSGCFSRLRNAVRAVGSAANRQVSDWWNKGGRQEKNAVYDAVKNLEKKMRSGSRANVVRSANSDAINDAKVLAQALEELNNHCDLRINSEESEKLSVYAQLLGLDNIIGCKASEDSVNRAYNPAEAGANLEKIADFSFLVVKILRANGMGQSNHSKLAAGVGVAALTAVLVGNSLGYWNVQVQDLFPQVVQMLEGTQLQGVVQPLINWVQNRIA